MQKNEPIFVVSKGYPHLDIKGVRKLIKICQNFLLTGKIVWEIPNYIGITGSGRCLSKYKYFIWQLEQSKDIEECVILAELASQVILKMQDPSFPLIFKSEALRDYFAILLRERELDPQTSERIFDVITTKRILLKVRGHPGLDIKGIKRLIKVCENFLSNGTVVWAMSHYMGLDASNKDKNNGKFRYVLFQLDKNKDIKECVTLSELIKQVIIKLHDPSFPLVIKKDSLRVVFAPLLKKRKMV